jgi:hypothetical protein
MHGQQNDKYTEMHGQQNDKRTAIYTGWRYQMLCKTIWPPDDEHNSARNM